MHGNQQRSQTAADVHEIFLNAVDDDRTRGIQAAA